MSSVEQRVTQILAARQITRADQYFLMRVFTSGDISTEDEVIINQIYEALKVGRLRVVE